MSASRKPDWIGLGAVAAAAAYGGAALLLKHSKRVSAGPAGGVGPLSQRPTAPPRAGHRATVGASSGSRAGGLLLSAIQAGTHEPIAWSSVEAYDLRFEVATDAVQARAAGKVLRLPISYRESIEACRSLGDVIVPSQKLADAIYNASSRLVFHSQVLTPEDAGDRMHSIAFSERLNKDIDTQIAATSGGGLLAGAWKYWILHPRISVLGAVNYGGWDAHGKPQQAPGARHDAHHYDYSQLLQPVQRFATSLSTGERVDLLDWIEREESTHADHTGAFR